MVSKSIDMSANGISTFCCDYDLDFSGVSGLKAYIVSGFSPSTGKLTLTPVTEVPAGEGLLLKGAEGSYEVPYTTTDMYYSNLLTGVTTTTNISPTDGDQTNFILANGSHGIGFYTIDATGPLAAGKAYLHLPTTAVSALARCFIFDFENEEASGIVELEAEAAEADGCFDLQGRHVLRPSNGIYIVNGKRCSSSKLRMTMKRIYSRPSMRVVRIEHHHALLQGSDVYTDNPQSTGNALSRRHDSGLWDDEE